MSDILQHRIDYVHQHQTPQRLNPVT